MKKQNCFTAAMVRSIIIGVRRDAEILPSLEPVNGTPPILEPATYHNKAGASPILIEVRE